MSASNSIRHILVERNMSMAELARLLGTTRQNLSKKMQRDSFSYNEYVKIADLLGCDVVTIMRDSKKTF